MAASILQSLLRTSLIVHGPRGDSGGITRRARGERCARRRPHSRSRFGDGERPPLRRQGCSGADRHVTSGVDGGKAAGYIGGGALLGTIVGAITGGGKGAAIGSGGCRGWSRVVYATRGRLSECRTRQW